MVYNSDNFVVVEIDLPGDPLAADDATRSRGGYEIVDKFARREIYLEGVLAQQFREGVAVLARSDPTAEEVDEFIGRFTGLPQQPLVLH
jgi:hypothetical protein